MEEILDNNMTSASDNAPIITKSEATYRFSKLSEDDLATKLQSFLLNKNYKLEEGTAKNGLYGKGSKVLRILFGAFVKRFAWQITISSVNGSTQLVFFKQAKGYVGGVIGVAQVNSEFNSIVNSLTAFHEGQEMKKY